MNNLKLKVGGMKKLKKNEKYYLVQSDTIEPYMQVIDSDQLAQWIMDGSITRDDTVSEIKVLRTMVAVVKTELILENVGGD
jgi:hypothetical protein